MSTATASAVSSKPDVHDLGFQRRLGLFDSTMLIMGTMIGSGIFVTSADIARDVGSSGWLLVVWAIAGVMTILGALSYAELSGMMPHAGGQYVYLREAYSPMWGFLYGWTCFLVIQTGSIAAVGVAFAKYLGVLVPALGADAAVPKEVAAMTGFFPDLGWRPGTPHAIVVFARTHLDFTMSLPIMGEFYTMKHFVVTAGQLVAAAVIVFLTWLNCRGVQEGKIVQNVMTLAKTAALILLIVVGIFLVSSTAANLANMTDPWGGLTGTGTFSEMSEKKIGETTQTWGSLLNPTLIGLMVVGGAMVGALFSADAWNNITFTAGEIQNPRRNMPLSLLLGTGTVILLYMLANYAYVASLPVRGDPKKAEAAEATASQIEAQIRAGNSSPELARKHDEALKQVAFERGIDNAADDRVATAVMELWSPRLAAPFMAIAIMISTFGCINGMILMGARLYYAMAVDNLFFKKVGTLNPNGVPAVGLITQSLWSILLVFSGSYNELLDFVIFAVLVFYVLTVGGLFILRRTQPNAERPYKAWGYPVLPALYVFLCAVIMLDLLVVKPKYTWPGLLIVLSGIPVYFLWRIFGKGPAPMSALAGLPPTEDEVKLPPAPSEEGIQPPNNQVRGE
jgi:basic amino acid/polyamine antiporter, APA family